MTQFLQKPKNKKKIDIKRILWVKETEEIYQPTAMNSNSNKLSTSKKCFSDYWKFEH